MSSNNIIYIIKQDGEYRAYDTDSESSEIPEREPDIIAKTMEEMVEKVQDYMSENIVEYGYRFLKSNND
jgi:hypothetical protein